MKCRNPNCKKEVKFMDWIIIRRCCVDCWMVNFELPKLNKFGEKILKKVDKELEKDK